LAVASTSTTLTTTTTTTLVKRSGNANNGGKTNNNNHPSSSNKNINSINIIINNNNHKVNRCLQSLLTDDTGEQEMEMYPDHSPEAAMQMADLKSYSKLNEEGTMEG
jgi:hypothetical protein